MKWVPIFLGTFAALIVLMTVIGALRPKSHVASVSIVLRAAPPDVWAVITDYARLPEWFAQITKVERLEDRDGRAAWRQNFGRFAATMVVTEWDPPRKVTNEIQPDGPFYGTWTWELAPEGAGTRLTITERGTVDNPFFRGMMVLHDDEKSAREYGEALKRRLGEWK